mmetsp:Transcript_10791/g.14069  ORF Transcript_10791/g.14069 Transcript_10791/m.14069 type:complete len:120 (+) Transcript_10791:685-1044(+)
MNLSDNLQILAQIKAITEVMQDLVEDEKNNEKGMLLFEYQEVLKLFEEAYEHKKNIFTQNNILQSNEFTCERNLLKDNVKKMKIISTLLTLKKECGYNEKMLKEVINDDEDLKNIFSEI